MDGITVVVVVIVIIIIIIVVVKLITLLITYLLGNIHLSRIVREIRVR